VAYIYSTATNAINRSPPPICYIIRCYVKNVFMVARISFENWKNWIIILLVQTCVKTFNLLSKLRTIIKLEDVPMVTDKTCTFISKRQEVFLNNSEYTIVTTFIMKSLKSGFKFSFSSRLPMFILTEGPWEDRPNTSGVCVRKVFSFEKGYTIRKPVEGCA
jgi:hypothetical protein